MNRGLLIPRALLIGCVFLLLTGVALTCFLVSERQAADRRVMHALQVENQLSRLRILMLKGEVQKRGFVMGGPAYLRDSAHDFQRRVWPELVKLKGMTRDNPSQQRRIADLQALYHERVAVSRYILELASRGEPEKATAVATSRANQQRQDRWSDLAIATEAEERRLLNHRQSRARALETPVMLAIAASIILSILLAVLLAAERRRKIRVLGHLNALLEEDIIRRAQLEGELVAARASAETAAEGKANFLANMSHEIRTPMNGVLGFADLLLGSRLDAQQIRHAQLIADSGKAMMRLLNDILDFSKIEAGKMRIVPERVDLRHKLKNCVNLMQSAAAQKHLELRCEIDDAVPTFAMVDGLRLRQILLNLVSNAVKFTQEGHVTLSAQVRDDGGRCLLEVSVTDTGIGIPSEQHAAVFNEFVQAEESTARRFGGTGLGLAISKNLAVMMGGDLTFESAVGSGTVFKLAIPVVEAAAPSASPDPASDTLAGSSSAINVLLAEDHDVNQELMQAMLAHLGHRVSTVADGARAVEAVISAGASGRQFDIILMDMQMPVMDGLSATRAIRSHGFGPDVLPILALTANAYPDDIAACLREGMQAHIAKPVQLQQLSIALSKWAAKSGVAQASERQLISPALRAKYEMRKTELQLYAARLQEAGNYDDGSIEQLRSLLHKLAGSAGMFQEAELGAQAAEFEDALEGTSVEERERLVGRVLQMRLAA
ncbi:ATP-binding protein [Sphingomonas psychrotolerans]|uniref:histidine kinase n=1 Tax=Sphingomonas psychrotolerans TaxID=1327635 RepID=A0ABU3N6N1_9SPHN|nr:ATP-binding protein [Sphingomonas psychrotolerans]MDT8759422.1 ATP-binding protein [Sphingomonas psychrotolerans]